MRRTALIFGLFLTLTAGAWGSALVAVVSACCTDETRADAAVLPASDEHDCCRAKLGEPDAPPSESTKHAHDAAATAATATHEDALAPEPQADGSHAGMDCEGAQDLENEPEREARAAAFGERVHSCFECCAGHTNQTPTTAAISAPEPNKVKRAAAPAPVGARASYAPAAPGVSHLTPSQHAPPVPPERRHMLISVFLI